MRYTCSKSDYSRDAVKLTRQYSCKVTKYI